MELKAFDKIVMKFPVDRPKNGRVIGIKKEADNSTTYFVEPRSVKFGPLMNGKGAIRINTKDIGESVLIEKHSI